VGIGDRAGLWFHPTPHAILEIGAQNRREMLKPPTQTQEKPPLGKRPDDLQSNFKTASITLSSVVISHIIVCSNNRILEICPQEISSPGLLQPLYLFNFIFRCISIFQEPLSQTRALGNPWRLHKDLVSCRSLTGTRVDWVIRDWFKVVLFAVIWAVM
jgi:hypothetical protein